MSDRTNILVVVFEGEQPDTATVRIVKGDCEDIRNAQKLATSVMGFCRLVSNDYGACTFEALLKVHDVSVPGASLQVHEIHLSPDAKKDLDLNSGENGHTWWQAVTHFYSSVSPVSMSTAGGFLTMVSIWTWMLTSAMLTSPWVALVVGSLVLATMISSIYVGYEAAGGKR